MKKDFRKGVIVGALIVVGLAIFGGWVKNKWVEYSEYSEKCEKVGGVILADNGCYRWGFSGELIELNSKIEELKGGVEK